MTRLHADVLELVGICTEMEFNMTRKRARRVPLTDEHERVEPVEAVGWDGDAIEAQAFGFLAVRSLRGLPLSVPSTTGVPVPTTGGQLHHAA